MCQVACFAGLLLLVLGSNPALSQEQCGDRLTACTNELLAGIQQNAASGPQVCSMFKTYMSCIKSTGCPIPEKEMNSMMNNVMAPLKTQGVNCDIDGIGAGSGSPTESGTEAGTDFGMYGMEECTNGMEKCTTNLTAGLSSNTVLEKGACGILQEFVDCIFGLKCPIPESQRQALVDQSLAPMRKQGLNCDIKVRTSSETEPDTKGEKETGTDYEIRTESGSKTAAGAGNFVMLLQIQGLFTKNGCNKTFESCAAKFSGPDNTKIHECSEIRKSGQCMFTDCTAIKGTSDEEKVAKLLVKFASENSDCEFTAEELMENGGHGAVQRPVWSFMTVLVVAALATKLLF
ncbi:hypothetical protein RRG08_022718 [Elysia crispata]|uniref:Uncharacterized protein n=1 Tax=Elysia crispata TaxID=231223 RepID=A0AAE1DEG2_9GAST|nr:hypothetical protein RRG08_022718 [Elysia crispata]